MERRQFEGVLVCLGTAVYQEEAVILIARYAAQLLGKLLLQTVDHGIGIETECGNLTAYCLHVMRMCMADADYCMTAVKVQILLAFVIPHFLTLSLHDINREQAVYWKKIHRVLETG